MFSRRLGDRSVAAGNALRHFCVPVPRVFLGGNVDKERVKVLHVLLCVILHAVLIYFYV